MIQYLVNETRCHLTPETFRHQELLRRDFQQEDISYLEAWVYGQVDLRFHDQEGWALYPIQP